MAWFLSNLRYVAWTAFAVGALFLIYFAMGVAGYTFAMACSGKRRCVGATCSSASCGSATSTISTSRKSPTCRSIPDEQKPAVTQGDRTGRALLVPLGRDALTLITGLLLAWNQRLSAASADAWRR